MIKTFSLGLDLLKGWFNVGLESSNCKKLLFNFCKARLIENHGSTIFLQNSQTSLSPCDV